VDKIQTREFGKVTIM